MYTSCERGSSLLFLRIDVCKENRSSWITANQEKAPLTHLLEIEQPIINNIFILKPFFSRSLSFTTGGRTWRFGCILHIMREKKKSRIQGLYHLKFLITFGCTAYRARFLIMTELQYSSQILKHLCDFPLPKC